MENSSLEKECFDDGLAVIQQIRTFSEGVKRKAISCTLSNCPHCGVELRDAQPSSFHGTRLRRFLVIAGSYVRKVKAILPRWKCPHCCRTFTEYPRCAVPHKGYTLGQMSERSYVYVGNAAVSYEMGVRSSNRPIYHEEVPNAESGSAQEEESRSHTRTLAHTSLFRWVTWFGHDVCGKEGLNSSFVVAPLKYRTERRKSILIECHERCSLLLSGSE